MKRNITLRYTIYGALFGLVFPIVSSLTLLYQNQLPLSLRSLLIVQLTNPLQWIINPAPFFLGLFGYWIGRRQARLQAVIDEVNHFILDRMSDPALVLDAQFQIIDINPPIESALGQSKAQLQGKSVSNLIPGWSDHQLFIPTPIPWETTIGEGLGAQSYRVEVTPLTDWLGPGDFLVVLPDITESKQRARELTTLLETTQAVSSTLDLEDTLTLIAQQMTKVLDMDYCVISRLDKAADVIISWIQEWSEKSGQGVPAGTVYRLEDYPATRRVLDERQSVLIKISDPEADPAERALMNAEGVKTLLILPLAVGDRVLGIIELTSETYERDLSPVERELARALADQAAITIDNARLYTESQENLAEIQALHRRYVAASWADTMAAKGTLDYTFERRAAEVRSMDKAQSYNPRILQAPIKLRDQVIGVLTLEAEPRDRSGDPDWTPEERQLVDAVADQAAQALESARLLEETQRQVEQQRLTAGITSKVWASTDIETILSTTLHELGNSLGVSEGLIQLDVLPGDRQEIY